VIDVEITDVFDEWLDDLSDRQAKRRIQIRIDRLRHGNFGDHRMLTGGIGEMRIDYGPGYRLYFAKRGDVLVVLLCGGDKRTQSKDIASAQAMAAEL
jgi:putative addiction module killer protein